MPEFITERHLLLVLCVIGVVGFAFIHLALTRVGQALDGIQDILRNELGESITTAIRDAGDQKDREVQQERLNAELEMFEALSAKKPPTNPFVFAVDAEAAELMDRLHPCSMAGWEKPNR